MNRPGKDKRGGTIGRVNKSEGDCCRVQYLKESSIKGPWTGGVMGSSASSKRPIRAWNWVSEFDPFWQGPDENCTGEYQVLGVVINKIKDNFHSMYLQE